MLAEPPRTRYDLNFRLFRFPVRIEPWFWVMTILLGASTLRAGVQYLAAWVVVVFISILVHELGHAFAFRRFGSGSHIVLYSFGGLAVPWNPVRNRGKRILVALAGPFAGFLLCGIVYGSIRLAPGMMGDPILAWIAWQLVFVNLVWGIVNLLPIWPLDGGQVCEEICTAVSSRNGREMALQISIVLAGVISLYSLACVVGERQRGIQWIDEIPFYYRGTLWTAILFGLLAYNSYQMLQRARWAGSHWS